MNFIYNVPNVSCYSCQNDIAGILKKTRFKIDEAHSNPFEQRIAIEIPSEEGDRELISAEIRAILTDAGYDCTEIPAPTTSPKSKSRKKTGSASTPPPASTSASRTHLVQGMIGTILGLGFMTLCLTNISIPLLGMTGLAIVSVISTLALGGESYYQAVKKFMQSKTMTMDTLFTVSTLSTMGVTLASLFYPGLPMMMEAGLLTFGFRHLGKAIEESIKQKITKGLSFRDRAPKYVDKMIASEQATVTKTNWKQIDINQIKPDDIIRIKRGCIIPLDGECLNEKKVYICDRMIRGSTLPRSIRKGDEILAGMEVPSDGDFIYMRVTRSEEESHLAQSDLAIAKANAEKAPIEHTTSRILKYFVPAVFGIAALSGVIVSSLFNLSLAIQCATSVLVSACPCTLGFITPLAVKVGMAKALEHGVIFKSGKAVQSADQIDVVVFDLNGTITKGEPEVTHTHQQGMSEKEFLNDLYQIEKKADHPIAKLVCRYIKTKSPLSIAELKGIKDTEIVRSHSGIAITINHEKYLVGNNSFMRENNISLTPIKQQIRDDAQQIVYLAKNQRVVGYMALKDPIRPEAKKVINELKNMGKEVHICTGADVETAKRYAQELNIDIKNVHANCVDATANSNINSKIQYIEALQKSGKLVAMIGDAGNDALALKKSNFGIAIRSNFGDEVTEQQADALIIADEKNKNLPLVSVLNAFSIAKQTVHSIKQNLLISLFYNSIMMTLAGGLLLTVGFALNPGICAAIMGLQTSFILLNEFRIKRKELSYLNHFIQLESENHLQNEAEIKSSSTRNMTQKLIELQEIKKPEERYMNGIPLYTSSLCSIKNRQNLVRSLSRNACCDGRGEGMRVSDAENRIFFRNRLGN